MSRRMNDLLMAVVFAAVFLGVSQTGYSGPSSQTAPSPGTERAPSTAGSPTDVLRTVQQTRDDVRELRREVQELRKLLESGVEKSGPLDSKGTMGTVAPGPANPDRSTYGDGVYFFYAPWCAPCRRMDPMIDRLKAAGLPITRVNIDDRPQMTRQFAVKILPTLVVIADRAERKRITGIPSETDLRKLVTPLSKSERNPIHPAITLPPAQAFKLSTSQWNIGKTTIPILGLVPVDADKGRPLSDLPTADEIVRSLRNESPSDLASLFDSKRDVVRLVVEELSDSVGECRSYPLVGRARLTKCHFKCTVHYANTVRWHWPPMMIVGPSVSVVYFDHDRLVRCPEPTVARQTSSRSDGGD